jgi:DNA repair protein RecN (Recombination protein N)
MLNKLYVRNFALIKELEMNFDRGLTIITGETGAGKSILIGALSLMLGNRADSSNLIRKNSKCIVEGKFNLKGYNLKSFFQNNDLDYYNSTVMRREISATGRSRAFINDTPVTLELMKDFGSRLIDIHSQHQTLMLGNNSFQLAVLDSFAGHDGLIEDYKKIYISYREIQNEFEDLTKKAEQHKADFDYYSFQLKQLEEARLVAGEETELKELQELLSHSEEIHDSLAGSSHLIGTAEGSALNNLYEIRRFLQRINDYYPESEQLLQRIESVIIELNDLANEMGNKAGNMDADPAKLEEISSRLDMIYSLMQKHHVDNTPDLIKKKDEIGKIVENIITGDERLEQLRKLLDKTFVLLSERGAQISSNRLEVVDDVEKEMNELLVQLGMPNGRFLVKISASDAFLPVGMDHIDFFFSANKQINPENLGKVASGGELSRVMLSIKSLLTDNKSLPTIFFDEIDAGVSGEVATRVGQILSSMGKRMQVINITHLPQVASQGQKHYHVYKEDTQDSTITHIKLLSNSERLNEVARLLSGNEITKASIDNARELMKGS